MVIHDFDFMRFVVFPNEADAELIVDSHAVLTLSISLQSFQWISSSLTEVQKTMSVVEDLQFAASYCKYGAMPSAFSGKEERLRFPVSKRLKHNLP